MESSGVKRLLISAALFLGTCAAVHAFGPVVATSMNPAVFNSSHPVASPGGGGGNSPILDSFNDNNETGLSTHTANAGSTWTFRTGGTNELRMNSNKLYAAVGGSESDYYWVVNPTDGDYGVCGTYHVNGSGQTGPSVNLRAQPGAKTFYSMNYNGGTWQVREFNEANGINGTSLGSFTGQVPTSDMRFCFVSSGTAPALFELVVNSSSIIRAQDAATVITVKGQPGTKTYFPDLNVNNYVDELEFWDNW